MSKIKVIRDNAVLTIEEEALSQYEARGYFKIGATKKVAPEKLEKENTKLKKINEESTKKVAEMEKKIK